MSVDDLDEQHEQTLANMYTTRTTQPKGTTMGLTGTTATTVTLTLSNNAHIEVRPMDTGCIRVEWFVLAGEEKHEHWGPTIYMAPTAAERLGHALLAAVYDKEQDGPMNRAARVAGESNKRDALIKAHQLVQDAGYIANRQHDIDEFAAHVRHQAELDIEGEPYENPDAEHSIRQCEGQCNDPAHNMLTPNEIYEASIREDLSDQAAREMVVMVVNQVDQDAVERVREGYYRTHPDDSE